MSPPIKGIKVGSDEPVVRRCSDDEPFAGLAFKIMSDPFVGSLTFIRIYSGVVTAGSQVLNSVKGSRERVGRMLQMHANHREDIKEARAGDIVALAGLKNTTTGDTLSDPGDPVVLERMEFPEPVIEIAVEPKTKGDQEKMGQALARLATEDPSFRVAVDHESGQTMIKGMGELHLEIIVDRMKREFKVDANVGAPQVAYRETITRGRRGRLHAQEADRRRRPVCPRQAALRAVAAGLRLCLRECGGRRHGAEGIRARCREGAQGLDRNRRAGRLPGHRPAGDIVRRRLSRRRIRACSPSRSPPAPPSRKAS